MKILFAKTFGIGNAVMAVPALKALRQLLPQASIDVLVGDSPDDFGALQVMQMLSTKVALKVITRPTLDDEYDLAILSIPYDGRWKKGIHFRAKKVVDGRTRPDPSSVGLASWKKHEVEYQMDNIRELGYSGETPDCSFLTDIRDQIRTGSVYLGIGYKKDSAGFWKVKHWGNENFIELIKLLLSEDPDRLVVLTGGLDDRPNMVSIMNGVSSLRLVVDLSHRLLSDMFRVQAADMYIGNDTGMMHVAASCGIPTVGMFFLENSATKSSPWCKKKGIIDGSRDRNQVTPEFVFESLKLLKEAP